MIYNLSRLQRLLFNVSIRLTVFRYITGQVVKGKIPLRRSPAVLNRLEVFLRKMRENKFVSIDGKTRIALYVPGVPSRAFTTACDKFTVFDDKLPCTTVLVSITSACTFKCPHCYQKNDLGKDVPLDHLIAAIRTMQDSGIAFFNIEGGEPFLAYNRLKAVCEAIDTRSEIWINSTGCGISRENLTELKERGVTAIMFPLHHNSAEEMNRFMGSNTAWDTIHSGITLCHEIGIPVALNMCLLPEHFHNGTFEECMEKALQLGAAILQIIKPKPAGGWLDGGAPVFSEEDMNVLRTKVLRYNHAPRFRPYPAISAQVLEEDAALFGCTAGGTDRFYLNAKGDVQPCEFLNISFGNITGEDFSVIYQRMRTAFRIPGCDWLCEKYSAAIADTRRECNVAALPLPKELSRRHYEHWDRGRETPLYKKLEGR
ncbi:MAG: radical SAM protein [Chitinispirillaceae bacterium]|nr:radical SAM protein [Chitinispirillaceae bacterium]